MSTETPAPPVVVEKKEEDNNLLGINFNNPFVIGGLLLAGIPVGIVLFNFLKGFIFKEPQQQQQQIIRKRPLSTEDIRAANYQRQLDRQNQLSEEQKYIDYIKKYGIINSNNKNLQSYNVVKKPLPVTEEETEIDIIDDNMIDYNNYQFNKQVQRPPFIEERPVRQQKEEESKQQFYIPDSTKDEEISEMIDNEEEITQIPQEFVNVGNRPEAFENIQPVARRNNNDEEREDDIYALENLEISEDDLKNMEAKAMLSNNEYY